MDQQLRIWKDLVLNKINIHIKKGHSLMQNITNKAAIKVTTELK